MASEPLRHPASPATLFVSPWSVVTGPSEDAAANVRSAGGEARVSSNLTAPILATRAALGTLRTSGHGLVVNLSSAIALVGIPFYSVYAATKAGPEHGFEYESPVAVAEPVIEAMIAGRISVIRGGETRSQMIARNQGDPGSVDRMLAERKDALEETVAGHASL